MDCPAHCYTRPTIGVLAAQCAPVKGALHLDGPLLGAAGAVAGVASADGFVLTHRLATGSRSGQPLEFQRAQVQTRPVDRTWALVRFSASQQMRDSVGDFVRAPVST